jgi:hypothetical protein
MSFPIYRADLQDVSSPKLHIDSITLPESSTFIEKRVLTLSKQILNAITKGQKSVDLFIIIAANVEPIIAGLKVNFPDVSINVKDNSEGLLPGQAPKSGGPDGRATQLVVNWE